MILGGSVYGVSTFSGVDQTPTPSEYTQTQINGEGIFDAVWVRNIEMTDAEIMALSISDEFTFDGTTIMLANFNNNIGAGSVESLTNPITGFDVNRRKTTETTFTRLAQVDDTVVDYNDITAEPNATYIYEIFALSQNEISEPIIAEPFESNFYNWILIDPDTEVSYIFNLDIDSSGFGNEINYQRYDGYNKYSQFSFGDRDFLTGSVSAVVVENPCDSSGEVIQTVDFLNGLRSIINNGKEKILKSRKGHVLRVVTTEPNNPIWLDELNDQLYRYSFNFTEVGTVISSGS